MTDPDSWYSQDAFWETFGPILFTQERRANAQDEVARIVKLLAIDGPARILDLC